MGAYLSEPITEKISSDEANDLLACGASQMQGWRISQEDAHNCNLDFDTNTSFFAVYDGHGGAEIALYCSQKFPDFLKATEAYKNGNIEQALKDAFLGFDATLLEPNVIEELKILAGDKHLDHEETETEDEEEDLAELCQEGRMPLTEVLEKYKEGKINPALAKLKDKDNTKPLSPFLRGRKSDEGSSTSRSGILSTDSSSFGVTKSSNLIAEKSDSDSIAADLSISTIRRKLEVDIDSTVSSSSTKDDNGSTQCEKVNSEATLLDSIVNRLDNEVKENTSNDRSLVASSGDTSFASKDNCNSPDSSSTTTKTTDQIVEKPGSSTDTSEGNIIQESSSSTSDCTKSSKIIQNGNMPAIATEISATTTSLNNHKLSQENEISTNTTKCEGVSSSSSFVVENGEISSNSFIPVAASSSVSRKVEENPSKDNISSTNNRAAKRPTSLPYLDGNGEEETSSEDEKDITYNEGSSSTEDGEEDCEMGEEESDLEDDYSDDDDDDDDKCGSDDMDDVFMNNMVEEPGKDSGCTAVVAVLHGIDLYVANAGDSRCVVCRKGATIEMSLDHKPEDDIEYERIKNAGGKVTLDGRVNGGLNLSRAIGDHAYKMNSTLPPHEQMISALPDVKKMTLTPDDEFMILACDGIWNFMSSENVVQFVKQRIDEGKEKLSEICEELFDNCLAADTAGDGTGCDNMTAIIVKFNKIGFETSEVTKKRAASPIPFVDDNIKRLKTDELTAKETSEET